MYLLLLLFSVAQYNARNRVGKGNLIQRVIPFPLLTFHSITHFRFSLSSSGDIACCVANLNAALCFVCCQLGELLAQKTHVQTTSDQRCSSEIRKRENVPQKSSNWCIWRVTNGRTRYSGVLHEFGGLKQHDGQIRCSCSQYISDNYSREFECYVV